jgi:Uncharacterized protein conserved in bacteria (DUF2333)
MNEMKNNVEPDANDVAFRSYAQKRIVVGILLSIVALWILGVVLGFFEKSPSVHLAEEDRTIQLPIVEETPADAHPKAHVEIEPAHGTPLEKEPVVSHPAPVSKSGEPHGAPETESEKPAHTALTHDIIEAAALPSLPRGVAFVTACIEPLDYELNSRFWGWRPNDIVDFTDNVNNFQLGVLEVTRRTAVSLAERLSRTGSTASFDIDLERAMNWFMIKSDRYWFPSAESKYTDGIEGIKTYLKKLERGEASFYTRADSLIPLLSAYEDLLGSCDENLAKAKEDDGSSVSFFKADNYFYYAKGVASAMGTVLEAVMEDFKSTLESRHAEELLHHAILSCHRAKEIDPWIVTEGSLSGILANHRANMAAPISHARFYLGVLIKTLST